TAAAAPLHVTLTMPDRSSCADPAAAIVDTCTVDPSIGVVNVSAGAVVSMLTLAKATALLPARSTAVPVTLCPKPSDVTIWSDGHVLMPDPLSAQEKWTVTGPLFQPPALGDGLSDAVIVGAPRSIVTGSLGTDAVFPALSVTVPAKVWMPSVVAN